MSEFGSESDDYTYASPSPTTRRIGPFLYATTMLSDDADPERSPYQAAGVLSQSSQSDDPPGEPVPTTSTPDLLFAASSSPFLLSTTGSPSSHTSCDRLQRENVAPRSRFISNRTPFVRHLDYLLQQAADQQRLSMTNDNIRIQPHSPEEVPGQSPMVLIPHDEGLESALGQRENYFSFSPLILQKSPRSSLLNAGTSDDNTLATIASDAGIDLRRNKRKARAEDSEALSTSSPHDENSSDSYLSASDSALTAPSRGRHLPSKKRKCLSLDTQRHSVSPCAKSPALSDSNLVLSKSSPVQGQQDFGSITTHDTNEGLAVQLYH